MLYCLLRKKSMLRVTKINRTKLALFCRSSQSVWSIQRVSWIQPWAYRLFCVRRETSCIYEASSSPSLHIQYVRTISRWFWTEWQSAQTSSKCAHPIIATQYLKDAYCVLKKWGLSQLLHHAPISAGFTGAPNCTIAKSITTLLYC